MDSLGTVIAVMLISVSCKYVEGKPKDSCSRIYLEGSVEMNPLECFIRSTFPIEFPYLKCRFQEQGSVLLEGLPSCYKNDRKKIYVSYVKSHIEWFVFFVFL